MSSKRKKSKNKSRAKSSLGISRKKNYTKNSPIIQDNNDNQVPSELSSNDPIEQATQNSETTLSYPYLKREIFHIEMNASIILYVYEIIKYFIIKFWFTIRSQSHQLVLTLVYLKSKEICECRIK